MVPFILTVNTAFQSKLSTSFSSASLRFLHLWRFHEHNGTSSPSCAREDLPIRERSTFNDQAVKAWQAGVSRGIQLFKQSNRLSQFEPWYQELVEQFCAVADFRRYWEQTPSIRDQHDVPSKLLLLRNATTEEWVPIELQNIRISVCSHIYPCIMAFRPLDDAGRSVFASLSSAEGSPSNAVSRC